MEIIIAGYNLDKDLINQITQTDLATPETISAAYARISRSSKSVKELRKLSQLEIQKSRESNQKIIFEMGHSSIAEHAVFNIDIIGISRYLIEFIQQTRLASFTEKSQRYVTLQGDFVLPEEIKDTMLESKFKILIQKQNQFYEDAYQKGISFLKSQNFSGTKAELEGKAKEDARYCLALATQTQMGMTINARSLARLLKRLDKLNLEEAKLFKITLEQKVKEITPSLIRYTKTDDFENQKIPLLLQSDNHIPEFKLLSITPNADDLILAAMLFENSKQDFQDILSQLFIISDEKKQELFQLYFQNMKSYHPVSRHFELASALFQIPMSASCFAQWKRHRLATIIKTCYHPANGYITPQLFTDCNLHNRFNDLQKEVETLYFELEHDQAGLGSYILTNSHKTVILFQANLRELYHFSRLRSDQHAQWEIRDLSKKLTILLREKWKLAALCLMGKDEFENLEN
jgi:flavin-dependent thymidylate synthase